MDYLKRLNKAREYMSNNGIDGMLLNPSGDGEYLSGIRRQRPNAGSTHAYGDWIAGLYVTQKEAVYVTPAMHKKYVYSQVESKSFINDVFILEEGKDLFAYAKDVLDKLGLANKTVAVPKQTIAKTLINFKKIYNGTQFVCTEDFVAPMRMIKEEEELNRMRKACALTDEIFMEVVSKIKLGMTEIDIANEIEYQMLLKGAEGSSFNTGAQLKNDNIEVEIEGINRFTNQTVRPGCSLAFDFGIILDGYCSDFGRTIYIGEPTAKQKRIHNVVMTAQAEAVKAMKAGKITAEGADMVARNYIENEGFVNNEFFHRLGHGIGIDTHEFPYLNSSYDVVLQEGMTFTVEPSIITDGIWTRVEDIVLVTKDGGVNLNNAPGVNDFIVIE